MRYIQGRHRSEIILFPQIENWVSSNNYVRLIDLIVEKIILSNPSKFIWKGLGDTGRKSYSPACMLKLFLYGYLNRIASSRRLEAETHRNIELMWLLGELHPDHWTINQYRKENAEQIRFITLEFRIFLKTEGYIKGEKLAIDGSKFKAYAAKELLSLKKIAKRMEQLEGKMTKYLEEFQETSILEELEFEEGVLTKSLVDKIGSLEEQISLLEGQKKQLEAANKNYLAPNDPDANLMKSRDGKIPAYNVQNIVDAEHKMIALSEISTNTNDFHELKKNFDALEEQLDIIPEIIEADTGYANLQEIKEIEEREIEINGEIKHTKCYIPLPKNAKKEADKRNGIEFIYDKEKDEYTCSAGKKLKLLQKNKKDKNNHYDVYRCKTCQDCPLRAKCTESKIGRTVYRNTIQDWIDGYKKRIKKAKAFIEERKTIVEHPFGTLKLMMGKFHFLLTGKEKVQIEIDLHSTVYNLKRLIKINTDNFGLLLQKVQNYQWKRA